LSGISANVAPFPADSELFVNIEPAPIDFQPYFDRLDRGNSLQWSGAVAEVVGLLIESVGPSVAVGDFCEIEAANGRLIRVQVIGFRNGRVLSMPLEDTGGLQLGNRITTRSEQAQVPVAPALLSRILDGFGHPIDGKGPVAAAAYYDLMASPPGPLEREHIEERLITGIRAIDSLLPCGKGQRVGIFGGSGVGKSTLLGTMARHSSAQINEIALIGKRNREVREFLEKELSPGGLARSVVVVATSDKPAPQRIRSCFVALAIAEYFRDQGKDVLLVMDSVTVWQWRNERLAWQPANRPARKGIRPQSFHSCPESLSGRADFRLGRSPGSLRCWWRGTISTSRSATPFARFWMDTFSSPDRWAPRATILQLTY
jgi:flagellum-specific ATP synthase